jgi:hypothetical protein
MHHLLTPMTNLTKLGQRLPGGCTAQAAQAHPPPLKQPAAIKQLMKNSALAWWLYCTSRPSASAASISGVSCAAGGGTGLTAVQLGCCGCGGSRGNGLGQSGKVGVHKTASSARIAQLQPSQHSLLAVHKESSRACMMAWHMSTNCAANVTKRGISTITTQQCQQTCTMARTCPQTGQHPNVSNKKNNQ